MSSERGPKEVPVHQVSVLGSTGSVGANTLDVIARHPGRFRVFALTASTQLDLMLKQCIEFQPTYAVMASEWHGRALEGKCKDAGLSTRVVWGAASIDMVASHEQVDIVMAAIVGAAGLSSCLAAALAGKRLLLANKEALVVGGGVFLDAVKRGGATLLPIDSEHSAIFQSLPDDASTWPDRVDKIILTASGGPFRARDPATLRLVTPDQACAHPNWVMGRKISVDSATMMNKALEVIEAKYLFDVVPDQLEVVIHPQSVIHSMVQYKDNSVVAQLGTPDMRGPIAYGLAWPDRIPCGASALDFANMSNMTFEGIHTNQHAERFPGLQLAWSVLRGSPGSPAILNAANEVAVASFLEGRIRFDQIHHVNFETLQRVSATAPQSLEDLLALDSQSRAAASAEVKRISA
jgi:1-deoxy-D-xylulose-5-phosphate reductoisomerase